MQYARFLVILLLVLADCALLGFLFLYIHLQGPGLSVAPWGPGAAMALLAVGSYATYKLAYRALTAA